MKGPAGTTYTLTFPASLAGLEVRIAAADAAALTWSSSIAVRDGITMEPAGTALAAPITVKASDPTATLYGVRIDGTTRTGTPLATSAGGFALPTIEAVAAGSGHEDAGVENDADSPVDATSDSTQAMPDASPRCVRVAST